MFHPLSTHSPSLNFSHSTVWNPEVTDSNRPNISKLHQEVQHRSHFLHTCSNDWLQTEKILLIYFSPKVALSLLDALDPLFLLDSDWRFGVADTSVFHSERQSGSKKTRSSNHNRLLNKSANHKPYPDYWMICDFTGTENEWRARTKKTLCKTSWIF